MSLDAGNPYDLSDPEIRYMVDRDHVPQERRGYGGSVAIHCEQCGEEWPCPPRLALRALEKK